MLGHLTGSLILRGTIVVVHQAGVSYNDITSSAGSSFHPKGKTWFLARNHLESAGLWAFSFLENNLNPYHNHPVSCIPERLRLWS